MDKIKWFGLSEKDKYQVRKLFPYYAFYKKYKARVHNPFSYEAETEHHVKYHCTACGEDIDIARNDICHNLESTCDRCGANVTFKANGYAYGGLTYKYNLCVFRADGENLQIRCFKVEDWIDHNRTQRFNFTEKHCYYFSKDGVLRFGADGKQRKDTNKEPIFETGGYYAYNGYDLISAEEINKTFLKYSAWEHFKEPNFIKYLIFYIKHPNAEYLLKTGFSKLVNEYLISRHATQIKVDWNQNDVRKMLGLTKREFQHFSSIRVDSYTLKSYQNISDNFQNLSVADKMELFGMVRQREVELEEALRHNQKHSLVSLITAIRKEKLHIEQCCETLREQLPFENEQFKILVPTTFGEIKNEGDTLNHCGESYATRHLCGTLHIVFIRTKEKLDVPFYTMEIDLYGCVKQVYGYGNKKATKAVQAFVDEYTIYLSDLFKVKEEKTA